MTNARRERRTAQAANMMVATFIVVGGGDGRVLLC